MADNRSSLSLVRAAQQGDDQALNALCARYLSWLTEAARLRLTRLGRGRNAAHDAEDVAIETLAKLATKIRQPGFKPADGARNLRSLVVVIMHGKLIDSVVRKKTPINMPDEQDFVLSKQDSLELRDLLHNLRESLPREELRTVATMVFDEEHQDVIARKLGCSVRTVQRLISEIRSRWSSLLPKLEGEL